MTNDDKALVERLRGKAEWLDPEIDMVEEWEASEAANRIEALITENERLREALRDVLVYAPDFMHGMPKKHYEKIANGKL